MARKAVTITEGKQARLDFDVNVGDITLTIGYTGKDGAKVDAAQVFLFGGVRASTGAEIQRLFWDLAVRQVELRVGADKPAKLAK
jgi:hypothetical protein